MSALWILKVKIKTVYYGVSIMKKKQRYLIVAFFIYSTGFYAEAITGASADRLRKIMAPTLVDEGVMAAITDKQMTSINSAGGVAKMKVIATEVIAAVTKELADQKVAVTQAQALAAQKAAVESTERAAREKVAREAAERDAAEQKALEQKAAEAAEREAREKAAEAAAKRASLEAAEKTAREAKERAAREAAEAAAKRAAREAAERAEKEKATREAAAKRAAEQRAAVEAAKHIPRTKVAFDSKQVIIAPHHNALLCGVARAQMYSRQVLLVEAPLFHHYHPGVADTVFAAIQLDQESVHFLPSPIQRFLAHQKVTPDRLDLFYVGQYRTDYDGQVDGDVSLVAHNTPLSLRPQYWCFPNTPDTTITPLNNSTQITAILLNKSGPIALDEALPLTSTKASISVHKAGAKDSSVIASGAPPLLQGSKCREVNGGYLSLWSIVYNNGTQKWAVTLHQIVPSQHLIHAHLKGYKDDREREEMITHINGIIERAGSFEELMGGFFQVFQGKQEAAPLAEDLRGFLRGAFSPSYDDIYGKDGEKIVW